jgi:hypothetical protein
MQMNNSRRDFLRNSSLITLGFIGLDNFAVNAATNALNHDTYGFGPLVHKPQEILSLPKGFTAQVISRAGEKMHDDLLSPGAHDGMGAFRGKSGKVILVRNHELVPYAANGPFGSDYSLRDKINKDKVYDFGKGEKTCVGGTTTMVYDEEKGKVELEYLSLVGTVRNCAGGITPWNSWITCEESDLKKGDEQGALEKDHGYNFEVKASEQISLSDPRPIKAMGRFVHEAVAVHRATGIVYQTEDIADGCFYRYVPNEYGNLHKGGKLQALALKEWKSADTRNWPETTKSFPQKKSFDVQWVDLDNVEAPDNDLRIRAFAKGAAKFARGEGVWFGKNELYFACTNGGAKTYGQIFKYTPSRYEGKSLEKTSAGKLELFLEPNNTNIFQHCDNLTVAPWGDVVICEDKRDPRIIGITREGKSYEIAKNIGYSQSEFAGPVFSPSGKTLFINIQKPGLTLAITGPWNKRV